MKTLFITALLLGSFSFSQTTTSGDPTLVLPTYKSLKEGMQNMSSTLQIIAKQAKDASKNKNSEELSIELMKSVMAAKAHLPSTVKDKDAQALYEKMMDDVIALTKQLSEAFQKNDNAQAVQMLNKLSQAKKDGHTEFKK